MRIAARIALVLISLPGAAWAVMSALGSAAWGLESSGNVRHTVTTTTSAGGPVTKVDVHNDNGEIIFQPGKRGAVTRTETWNFVRPSYAQSLRSGTLTIRGRCPENVPRNQCSVRLVITVPPTVDIDVTVTNGEVHATGFQSHTIAARSTNGGLTVTLDAQPVSLRLETTNGTVTAAAGGNIRAAHSNVTAKSTNGDVNVSLKLPPTTLSLATVNGSIHAWVPAGSYRLTTHTVFGKVDVSGLRNDPGASATVSAKTVLGDITLSGS